MKTTFRNAFRNLIGLLLVTLLPLATGCKTDAVYQPKQPSLWVPPVSSEPSVRTAATQVAAVATTMHAAASAAATQSVAVSEAVQTITPLLPASAAPSLNKLKSAAEFLAQTQAQVDLLANALTETSNELSKVAGELATSSASYLNRIKELTGLLDTSNAAYIALNDKYEKLKDSNAKHILGLAIGGGILLFAGALAAFIYLKMSPVPPQFVNVFLILALVGLVVTGVAIAFEAMLPYIPYIVWGSLGVSLLVGGLVLYKNMHTINTVHQSLQLGVSNGVRVAQELTQAHEAALQLLDDDSYDTFTGVGALRGTQDGYLSKSTQAFLQEIRASSGFRWAERPSRATTG